MSNSVILSGKINATPAYSHTVNNEKFFLFHLSVGRTSGAKDVISLIASEYIISITTLNINDYIEVSGEIRSFYDKNTFPKLKTLVFVKKIIKKNEDNDFESNNIVVFEGVLSDKPIFKTTATGRQITNLLVATNKNYNGHDFIPCISWGRVAQYAISLKPGTKLRIIGRIQSRKYTKNIKDKNYEVNVCEISVKRLEVINQTS